MFGGDIVIRMSGAFHTQNKNLVVVKDSFYTQYFHAQIWLLTKCCLV
jgi:hypothetical protein